MDYLDIPLPTGGRCRVATDSEGYFIDAAYYETYTGGSPLHVDISPPIGPIDTVNLGTIYQFVIAHLPG